MPDKEINGTLSLRCRLFSGCASMSGQSKDSVMQRNMALAARLVSLPHLFVFAMLCTCFLPKADAAAFTNINQYENSKVLSANPMYRWSAAVHRTETDGAGASYWASAVMIAPDLFINSGHFTPRNGSSVASLDELAFGANYNTSTERYGISHTERFPGFVFGNTATVNLGVGWTSNFVNGFNTPTVFVSSLPPGINPTASEYGNYGDTTTGELPSIGDRLGGRADTESAFNTTYDSSGAYFITRFSPWEGDPLNVNLLEYSSGSGWFTADGKLAGLTVAGTGTFDYGYTVVLDLSSPEIQAYLQPLIADSWARYYASLVPLSFDAWASAANLEENDALAASIPFRDGVPNLLKFAFNINGSGPDASRLVPISGVSGLPYFGVENFSGGAVFHVEFIRRKNAGLTYTPKVSTDLSIQSFVPMTGEETVTSIDDHWERVSVKHPIDPQSELRLFGVVQVELPN